MARVHPFQSNFTAGELSPRLEGQIDFKKYFNGCSELTNMIVYPHGGATRRGGMYFVSEVKTSSKEVRLIPFEFNVTQSYVLEFGDTYIRFYKDNGQIQSVGSAYEISTPYLEAELTELNFAQSADIMYVCHSNHALRKLSRTGHTSWTLTTPTFTWASSTPWTSGNGYPRAVSFYEQRLFFAGTSTYPQTIWGSQTADYENFDQGTGLADESMEYAIATNKVNVIRWLQPSRDLIVGTAGG